jgi:hypothetical protein
MIEDLNTSLGSQLNIYNMKYLLSILGIISLGLFASCGGAAEAECCGADGECCSGDHNHSEGNASE